VTTTFSAGELVDALIDHYPQAADARDAIRVVRAPGRVNLVGEHTDYNLGYVLPAAIDCEIRIAVVPTDDRRVDLTRLDTRDRQAFDLDLERPKGGTWLDYVAGVAWALSEAGHRPRGIRGVIASTLPAGAGLSSSAAIELASAWALLGDAASQVPRLDLALAGQRAENEYVGLRSGLMDQFSVACGEATSALLLDCRSLEWGSVPLPDDVALVVIESGVSRDLGASAYNDRRAECEAAVASLRLVDPRIESLRDVTPELLAENIDRLDPLAARRARHVVEENRRVLEVVAALARRDMVTVGQAFAASHASLRDLFEVSAPELDALVDIAGAVDGVLAARMTGGGFGGCTINLVRPGAVRDLEVAIDAAYPGRTGRRAAVMAVTAVDGAGLIDR
jgi:galactokinase